MVVTALGAHTAVGPGVDQTCASIRAGIARLQANEEFVALTPELAETLPDPISFAPAPSLAAKKGLEERLVALAAKAIVNLVPQSGLTRAGFRDTHLFLALPENAREGVSDLDGERMIRAIRKASSLTFEAGQAAFYGGHVAALLALDAARQLISKKEGARCLIAAADSNVLDANLDWLDRSWRLKSQRNVDGFIPGEAGGAFLVEGAAAAARRGAAVLARVTGIGMGEEANSFFSDAQSTGAGLSSAIGAACADTAQQPIRWVICDLNGESYRGREWGIAYTRLASRFQSPVIWHPAENIGDIGAASSAVHIAAASRAFARGYAPADRALIWCAADSKRRAACVIGAPGKPHSFR